MARKTKKQTGSKSSNESVIASRVLQDIINNSSASFRRYMESQGGAQQLAGGGSMPPVSTWGGMLGGGPPVQGPPAPPLWQPPGVNNFDRQLPVPGGAPGIPMPNVPLPNTPSTVNPASPSYFEDGSVGAPQVPLPHMVPQDPQQKSLVDLFRMLGLI